MKIICRSCKREVELGELIVYVVAQSFNKAPKIIQQVIVDALVSYFSAKVTKGLLDSGLAGFANLLDVECPQCNKKGVWDTISQSQKIEYKEKELGN